jgi:hypothetical protein
MKSSASTMRVRRGRFCIAFDRSLGAASAVGVLVMTLYWSMQLWLGVITAGLG